ncbi:neuronal PAS domain-containing protein 4A-like [Venturia canescens]|uniref:neuronal PAS domain-containing protein 4A-like n=1 Tax=Venturia canescens TaxID=32260 RepID=UPI001C9CA083|nr:neuronal PAS domain-containing protein 4A-like [Venturia canescens]
MFNRIDASKSTKGASKLRRDLINAEIANLRDLLPLPPSTRQRLSQLQLMALVCVFLRKANYFQQALKSNPSDSTNIPTPNIGFSKAMSGFIMMMTQQGKLLYISENAAEYLGHSMEDLLIHGDSVYDVIDKQDHIVVQNQLARNSSMPNERRLFLCRINVSRNSRRQLRFGDQKVVLVEGHYLPFVPLCNRNESVFLASCTPVVLPETRESVVQGATNIFTTIHSMDMKYLHIDKTAESHLEYTRSELVGVSWYNLLHWECIRTAYCKHQTVIQSDQERTSTALLRLQNRSGRWFWIHCVLQVKETSEECQHPIIVCTNQVLSDKEAEVMRSSSWLYQYSAQSKFTYGLCPTSQQSQQQNPPATNTYTNHDYNVRSVSLLSHETGESSPSYSSHEEPRHHHHHHQHHQHHQHHPQNSQISQQQQQQQQHHHHHHHHHHRNDVRSEPDDYATGNGGKVRLSHDEIEPVDMSINSTDHENSKNLYQLTHSLSYSPKSYHHHHHHHHQHQQQHPQHQHQHHEHQVHHVKESVSPVPSYRAKSTIIQYSNVGQYPGDSPVQKYNIIDLDVGYGAPGESCVESRISVHSPQRRNHQHNHPHHPHLSIKQHDSSLSLIEANETSIEQHWNSSSPPVWSDTLQRVPDVVHQELSPYITTPTTPVHTPDSELHSEVPVFNFEWSAGEQHVPISKVIVCRNSSSLGHPEIRKTANQTQDNSPGAPMTLQLPKRKNHADGTNKD